MESTVRSKLACRHCGLSCPDNAIGGGDNFFCCLGCQAVFEILKDNQLEDYYAISRNPGLRPEGQGDWSALEQPEIIERLLVFKSDKICRLQLTIPGIHCMSCIWLLEKLGNLQPGIRRCEASYEDKRILVDYDPGSTSPRDIASGLDRLGYKPAINLQEVQGKTVSERHELARLVVAGLCFGNVMLLTFPFYLGLDANSPEFADFKYFSWVGMILSLPTFFYSASSYWIAARTYLRNRVMTMDLPIFIGMIALMAYSLYDIFMLEGSGFCDSLNALIFFLLLGRYFQNKSWKHLKFDRDYKSFFPLWSHRVLPDQSTKAMPVDELEAGMVIRVRNQEIIPCDSRVSLGEGHVDYSFVSGESLPVEICKDAAIHAGGRYIGTSADLLVSRPMQRSLLVSMWNNQTIRHKNKTEKDADRLSRRFTPTIMALAVVFALWHWGDGMPTVIRVFATTLIVACPCALALSMPLICTFGSYWLARESCYLRQAGVVEDMAKCDTIVFDKTGTLTENELHFRYSGVPLDELQKSVLHEATGFSLHPVSQVLHKSIESRQRIEISEYQEIPGRGIQAQAGGHLLKLGSAAHAGLKPGAWETDDLSAEDQLQQRVHVSWDGKIMGHFIILAKFRKGIEAALKSLGQTHEVYLLSGDKPKSVKIYSDYFKTDNILFDSRPEDKLEFIKKLNSQGKKVLMIGDGLNDAGALRVANVGISVADDVNGSFPSSDALLRASQLQNLPNILNYCRRLVRLIRMARLLSLLYNSVGLSLAALAILTPLHAAILMPVSSLSVLLLSALGARGEYRAQLKARTA